MADLELSFESGESSLSVRRFTVIEAVSTLYSVSIWARSPDPSLDLESIAGKKASLRIASGLALAPLGGARRWAGICSSIAQTAADPTGLSTYHLRIVPELWRLTQRRNHRIFQNITIPDIADRLLAEWGLAPVWSIDRPGYPKLEYRVQYGETDYAFLCRLIEEAGIAFTFVNDGGAAPKLTFGDALQAAAARVAPPIPFADRPKQAADNEFVTEVRVTEEVRPGAYAIRDYDFRNPALSLLGEAPKAPAPEDRYEQVHYLPGGFLVETPGKGGTATPAADDKGAARRDPKAGHDRATRALEATRTGRRALAFATNAIDLPPGVVFSIDQHPRSDVSAATRLLVTELTIEGSIGVEWTTRGRSVFADTPYRPPLETPKPRVRGVESATVVGPPGQEIHTDEFGRVRVQFPWDRLGKQNEGSSCWIRVSQGWAGPGFGMLALPRIGQEVLVAFMNGDPDAPVVVGRVFDLTNPAPYTLPKNKTRGTWKSDSSPTSDGFNEILFEDLKGSELVYVQAQKNLRRLVKHDETSTVGNDREKQVERNETETTVGNRIEVTGGDRKETTSANRITVVGGDLARLVKQDDIEQRDVEQVSYVGKDLHVIVAKDRRELVEIDAHVHVDKSRSEAFGGRSLGVGGSQHEKMGGHHALEASQEIHFKAGANLVGEAPSITLKAPGGFILIDASGVTIKGTLVKINNGGSAGTGAAASAGGPAEPRQAMVQTVYALTARWLDVAAYCGDQAKIEGLVTPTPPDGSAKVEVILASTGATLATINTVVTSGRVGAVWVTKAPAASWRTEIIQFRMSIPSISVTGMSLNEFKFRQRPVTGWVLIDRLLPVAGGLFAPVADVHDTSLEADRVHFSIKLRTTGAVFPPARQANAKQLIEDPWNDGFSAKRFHRTRCGRGRGCDCAFDCCKAGYRLDVNFVTSGEHVLITMLVPPDPTNPPASGTSRNGSRWYEPPLDEPSVYAHETGHLMGQFDEYAGGGNDPTGVQPANSPVPNLMATRLNTTTLTRHYRWALEFLNDHAASDPYEIIPS